VKWFLQGRGGDAPIDPDQALQVVADARHWMTECLPGRALSEISKLKELGQVAFASKVVTFLDPELAAVYDSRIAAKIQGNSSWRTMAMSPQGRITLAKQNRYHRWCRYCLEIASQLNQGIEAGESWHWTDWDQSKHQWRPVDVERAIFVA
jgi:hypothetical protein